MAQSPFEHYSYYASLKDKHFSANAYNTRYTIGIDGEQYDGAVDIAYNKFVVIRDIKTFWTHGLAYKFQSIEDFEEAVAAAIEVVKAYTDERINSLATVNGKPLTNGGNIEIEGGKVDVDATLDDTSVNPVQNKVVTRELEQRLRGVYLEPDAFNSLRASDCEAGVLYFELGDVLDTDTTWHFGDELPMILS